MPKSATSTLTKICLKVSKSVISTQIEIYLKASKSAYNLILKYI